MDMTGIDFGLVKQGLALQERIEREEAIVGQLAQDIPNMIGRLKAIVSEGHELGMDVSRAEALLAWIDGGLSGAVAAGADAVLAATKVRAELPAVNGAR